MSDLKKTQSVQLYTESPAAEPGSLPFASTPMIRPNGRPAPSAPPGAEFESYLNETDILVLKRHPGSIFDPTAEILKRSVYLPIDRKRDPRASAKPAPRKKGR